MLLFLVVLLAAGQWLWKRNRSAQAYSMTADASQHNGSSLIGASRSSRVVVSDADDVERPSGSAAGGTSLFAKSGGSSIISKLLQSTSKGAAAVSGRRRAHPKGQYTIVNNGGGMSSTQSPFTISGEDDEEERGEGDRQAEDEDEGF